MLLLRFLVQIHGSNHFFRFRVVAICGERTVGAGRFGTPVLPLPLLRIDCDRCHDRIRTEWAGRGVNTLELATKEKVVGELFFRKMIGESLAPALATKILAHGDFVTCGRAPRKQPSLRLLSPKKSTSKKVAARARLSAPICAHSTEPSRN